MSARQFGSIGPWSKGHLRLDLCSTRLDLRGLVACFFTLCDMVGLNYCSPSVNQHNFPVVWILVNTGVHVGIDSQHHFGP